MNSAAVEKKETALSGEKGSFFRQGGWMMITAVSGGLLMLGVQLISKKLLRDSEYSAFAALLQVTNLMAIPALGLQMVFAQQSAAVKDEAHRRRLISTTKSVLTWTFCVWLVMFLLGLVYHQQWTTELKLSNEWSLWLTVVVGLVMLWQPIFLGLLQGRQNFLWLGWVAIINGAGRVVIGLGIVYLFHSQTAGLMAGVFIGLAVALATAWWQNMDLMREKGSGFHAMGWLKRVVPLTLGFGVSQFLFTYDAIVVQKFLGEDGKAANYMLMGTLCRAIVLFTTPLAQVMFPKLVSSQGRASKNSILARGLLATGALCIIAVLGLAATSGLFLKIFAKGDTTEIKALTPYFAMGMVPLAMGNVLLNYLMAHSRFKVVLPLCAVAAGYCIYLQFNHDSFRTVIQIFGSFTLAFLIICMLFQFVFQKESE